MESSKRSNLDWDYYNNDMFLFLRLQKTKILLTILAIRTEVHFSKQVLVRMVLHYNCFGFVADNYVDSESEAST